MSKVLVLGSSGMLGSMVTDFLLKNSDFKLTASLRDLKLKSNFKFLEKTECIEFDAEKFSSGSNTTLTDFNWIINAIGIIKPYIKDEDSASVKRAIRINSLFPHLLAEAVKGSNTKIIQIATDCVFSGIEGKYSEISLHDALDAYGKSKSLGEVNSDNFYNLRCSIIGPEIKGKLSLLEWFLGQKENAELKGFTNHFWNGVTTLHFAKICKGIIEKNLSLPSLQNITPKDILTKAEMVEVFKQCYDRNDIKMNAVSAPVKVDRTLATLNEKTNLKIWQAAGYEIPPTVEQMIKEMSEYNFND